MTVSLLDLSRMEMKLGPYGVGSSLAVGDVSVLPKVQDYRRRLSSRMAPLEKQDITKKMMPATYHVSRKIDGEFTVLVYHNGSAFCINPGGTVRVGLSWINEAAERLKKAQVTEAMIVGELYVANDARRPRVHDVVSVARQPQSEAELSLLQFAVFDLMSIDGKTIEGEFEPTWDRICQLFADGKKIHPVEARPAADLNEIEKLFEQWVEAEGGEGLVVRSETAGMFKVKPRHTLDAVVVGFTESGDDREGLLHDLLLAVRRQDGSFQILTRVGGGFTEEERRAFLSDLKDITVESEYAEINSDHVAYQMVRPEWVVEISCLDLVAQTTRGGAINRMVLDWNRDGSNQYHIIRRMPLVSVISPQFIRRREDKTPTQHDVRIQQVTEIVDVPMADRDARQFTLPKSQLLQREVYTKEAKGEVMVRKLVMWKTNKEDNEDYPAYVVHYTDFSPNRKAPLAREVRVSDSEQQIRGLWNELIEANIKRGWDLRASTVETPLPVEQKTIPAEPAKEQTIAAKEDEKVTIAAMAAETPVELPKAEIKRKAPVKKKAAKAPAAKEAVATATKKKAANTKTKKAAPKTAAPKKKAAKKKAAKAAKATGKMAKSAQEPGGKTAKKTRKKSG